MISEKNSNFSYVEKANFILSIADISASIVSYHQLKYVTPVIFIKIFQSFYHCTLQKINLFPKNKEDHILNMDILLEALKSTSPSSLLSSLTGTLLVSGDQYAIESLVNYFYFLALEIQKKRDAEAVNESHDSSSSSQANHHRANISIIKHSHIYISENISIDQRVTHNSSSQLQIFHGSSPTTPTRPDANGAGPESSSLSNRPSSNIYFPPTTQSQGNGSSRRNSNDGNTNDSVGRRSSNETDSNSDEETDEDEIQSVVDKKFKQEKKKNKKKKKYHQGNNTSPTQPTRNLSHKSLTSRNPSRPSSATHSRPHLISRTYPPPYHRSASPGIPRYSSTTSPPSPSPPLPIPVAIVGDIPCYDTYTGHRITPEEVESQRIHRKDKYLSLGVLLTDTGELLDKDSYEPISISQIQAIREKERLLLYHQSTPLSPGAGDLVDSKFPGKSTEKSVKKYVKKMKLLRKDAAAIAAVIDPLAASSATKDTKATTYPVSRTRLFPSYRYLTPHDFVISIEHCHSCDHHHPASGHDPQEYLEIADEILRYLSFFIYSMSPKIRLGIVRFPTKLPSLESEAGGGGGGGGGGRRGKGNAPQQKIRGALEVQIGYKKENGEMMTELIYSKWNTNQWPSKSVLIKRLRRLLSLYHIPTGGGGGGGGAAAAGVGEGGVPSWNEIPLSSENWEFQSPDKETRRVEGPFVWCFDSRPPKYHPKFYDYGTKVRIHHCPNRWGGIESYSCYGIIQEIVLETSSFLVKIPYFDQEMILLQSQCVPITTSSSSSSSSSSTHDPFAPPSSFETLNSIPITLSVVIQFALDHHFLTWSCHSADDYFMILPETSSSSHPPSRTSATTSGNDDGNGSPSPPNSHLFLSKQSFISHIGSLVWQCIERSPGKRQGTMRYKNRMDLSVQLAYSPPVIDYMIALSSDGISIDILKLMQTIRPSLTEEDVILLYDYTDPTQEEQEGEDTNEGDDVIGPISEGNETKKNFDNPVRATSPHRHTPAGRKIPSSLPPQQQQHQHPLDSLSYSKNDLTFSQLNLSDISCQSSLPATTAAASPGRMISTEHEGATGISGGGGGGRVSHSSSISPRTPSNHLKQSVSFNFPDELQPFFSDDSSDSDS